MEKWRRKASRERGFCGPFGKKTVGPVATDYHEPKRPIGASNFYRRDCKRQAQTLTVRYAKLNPGLRTPPFRICSPWLLEAASPPRGLQAFSQSVSRAQLIFALGKTRLRILQNFAGKGMTRAYDDFAP
jgi:hypothetical protein